MVHIPVANVPTTYPASKHASVEAPPGELQSIQRCGHHANLKDSSRAGLVGSSLNVALCSFSNVQCYDDTSCLQTKSTV